MGACICKRRQSRRQSKEMTTKLKTGLVFLMWWAFSHCNFFLPTPLNGAMLSSHFFITDFCYIFSFKYSAHILLENFKITWLYLQTSKPNLSWKDISVYDEHPRASRNTQRCSTQELVEICNRHQSRKS